MKTDDIFEAITDIDDKFIAEARSVDFNDDQPVVVYPASKKPLWKTLVPIAACLTVICAAAAFGVKYFKERPRSETSSGGGVVVSAQSVSSIDIPNDGSDTEFTMDEFPAFYFKVSNKAVTSILKTPSEYDIVVENSIFDGRIYIDDLYLADLNGDGMREICASGYDINLDQIIMVSDFADGLKCNTETGSVIVDDTTNGTLYVFPSNYMDFEYTLTNFGYSLAEEDDVLKVVKTVLELNSESDVPEELSREPLTLDMMTRIDKAAYFEKINVPVSLDGENKFVMEEFPGYSFTATHNSVFLSGYKMNIAATLIIGGDTLEDLYLCDLNGDGRRELCATVLNNGAKCVEVVDFSGYYCGGTKWYTLQGDRYNSYYLGRDSKTLIISHAEQYGSDRLVSSTQLSLNMMTPILSQKFSQEFSNNEIVATKIEAEKKFKLAEFPDKTFEITKHSIVMSDVTNPDAMIRPVISGIDYYLADLNGDGEREICCWGSFGSGLDYRYIEVYDIANDEHYVKNAEVMKELFSLDLKDGVLYAVTSEYHTDEDKEISREPLSLDILEKVTRSDTAYEEVPLYIDQIFTMEDLPGITFTVDTNAECPMFRFNWGSEGVSENVNRVFLYDIDGDGKREIALNCPFVGNGIIRIYGFMDNGEMGCAEYYENGGCWLSEAEDGTLKYYTNDKIEPFKFSKSDLKPTFARNYSYELLGWDHTLDFTDIISLGEYDVKINNRTIKIKHNGEQIFDSGISLQDLYSIPDKENNSVVLIYITESVGGNDGMVGAVKLSEKNAERYDFEKGVSIKPTTDELILVNADGSEEPFNFPENAEQISINN